MPKNVACILLLNLSNNNSCGDDGVSFAYLIYADFI